MLADILYKPMSVLIAVCIILSFLVCSTIITRTAANYQIRERSMRLANALVAYGQKNNGFSNSTIYTSNPTTATGTKDVGALISGMVDTCDLSNKCTIIYGSTSPVTMYENGIKSLSGINRLNAGDTFTIKVQPTYRKYLGSGTFKGNPIVMTGKAHGYIKISSATSS